MSLSLLGFFVAAGSAAHALMNSKAVAENAAEDTWSRAMDAWDACTCANRKCCEHAVAARSAKSKLDEATEEHAAARKGYSDWCKAR